MTRLSAATPFLFVVFCLASSLFLAMSVPPYMGVDEPAHVARANLTTLGRVVGERVRRQAQVFAGGPADLAIYDAQAPFTRLIGRAAAKADQADFEAASKARWDGRIDGAWYSGSATYPPVFYLPASAGLAIGKLSGLSVVDSLVLARMGNALACAAIGFCALLLAGRARPFFFTVLLLPMSLFLYGTVTLDGPVIVTAALGCAVVAGAMSEGRPVRGRELLAASLCFLLIGMTKPPYALMGLILLAVPSDRPRLRPVAAFAPLAVAALWTLVMAAFVGTVLTPTTDAGGQVRHLLAHPLAVGAIAAETLRVHAAFYARSFVGVMGWIDTWFPGPYYALAWLVLAGALASCLSAGAGPGWRRAALAAPAIALASAGATFAALYITWDLPGATRVDGVQGRYFLPIAFLLPLAVLGPRAFAERAPRWTTCAMGAILAFPVLGAVLIQHAVVVRFYLD